MPKINVYLPDELAEAVKETGLPVSAVCQHALELAVRRVTAIREALSGTPERLATETSLLSFTSRCHTVLGSAQQLASEQGTQGIGTEHVLSALLAEGSNLALRVLAVLDIEPGQIRAELARRRENAPADSGGGASATAGNSGAATPDGLGFGTQAAKALELAVNESTALGNNYIGCEHVLLGLIAEPDGAAGSVLRSLGADLRLTRRAVAAALAGYYHLQSRAAVSGSASGAAAGSGVGPGWASQLEAAIQAQLRPVIERLDQLERRAGSPA